MLIKEKIKAYFAKYNVKDIINSNMNYLFILESPHSAEIKNGYPVAGSSGVEMTKFIYSSNCNDAFGKLVNCTNDYQHKYNGLNQFSIMNISPAPMQESALENYELSTAEENMVHILEKLRINYQAKSHRNKDWNQVKKELINNFGTRLKNVLSTYDPEYIIPCGKLAQNYLNLAIINKELKIEAEIISEIPHPSRNQWRHYNTMTKLKSVLNKNIFLN